MGPQLTRNFCPPATPSRSLKGHVSGYRCRLIARSNCITCVERTHLCLPAVLIQLQGHHSLYPNGQLYVQAKLLFPPPPARH